MRHELTTCGKGAVARGGDRLRHDAVRWAVLSPIQTTGRESRRAEAWMGAPGSDSDSALPCVSMGVYTSLSEFPSL